MTVYTRTNTPTLSRFGRDERMHRRCFPGTSGRRLEKCIIGGRLTRRIVLLCIDIVLRDPALRSRLERELGYQVGPR